MPGTLADDEIIRLAQASKDGGNFDALWRGDWQGKYKSQSEADCALRILANHILAYNEPAKTVPILAWTASCMTP